MEATNSDPTRPGDAQTAASQPGAELAAAAAAQAEDEREIEAAAAAPAPVSVFRADTADEAEIVRGLLESEGIPAAAATISSAALGDILISGEDHWADVLVAPADAERALALVAAYQSGPPIDESEIDAGASAGEDQVP